MVTGALLCAASVWAQQATGDGASTAPTPAPQTAERQAAGDELGQGESLLYIGRKLWFETRKRLNLASNEELEAHAEEEKKVKLRIGGFKIEK